jgi:hypothetical protein
MLDFNGPLGFGKIDQFNITVPLRYRFNAFVGVNSNCLARMVRAKFADKLAEAGAVTQAIQA